MSQDSLHPTREVAPPPITLDENLDAFANRIGRLEAEAASRAGTGTYPEWWYQEDSPLGAIREQLKDPQAPPENVSRLFQLHHKQQRVRATIEGRESESASVGWICNEVGLEVAARGFRAETPDGPMHDAVLTGLAPSEGKHHTPEVELALLSEVYHTESVTRLLGVHDEVYAERLQPLLRGERVISVMHLADKARSNDVAETKAKTQEWMSQALAVATGIEESEAATYVFAAAVAQQNMDKSFANILRKFDYFGVDRLRTIHGFTDIAAFEAYSVAQLERMEAVANNPKEAAERLANHDVTVVMINRVGDEGTLANTAAIYEDDDNSTLLFEFANVSGIYRHGANLHSLGIDPSTLVLVAHSAPGQFIISDKRNPSHERKDFVTVAGKALVQFVNDSGMLGEGGTGYSMHGMKDMARLVEEYMQPSRALNDAEENAGRKKIIFHACDAGTEVDAKDITEEGSKFSMGLESVISRLGKDLLANGLRSNVDIYGAPSGIQVSRSARGVRYTAKPASLDEDRQSQHAVRIRIEGGHVSKQEVDEIVMRKGPSAA